MPEQLESALRRTFDLRAREGTKDSLVQVIQEVTSSVLVILKDHKASGRTAILDGDSAYRGTGQVFGDNVQTGIPAFYSPDFPVLAGVSLDENYMGPGVPAGGSNHQLDTHDWSMANQHNFHDPWPSAEEPARPLEILGLSSWDDSQMYGEHVAE